MAVTGCVKDLVEEEGERMGMAADDDVGVAGLEQKARLRNDQEEERALEGVNLRREAGGEGVTGVSDSFRFLDWR